MRIDVPSGQVSIMPVRGPSSWRRTIATLLVSITAAALATTAAGVTVGLIGDFNGDASLDCADVDLLVAGIVAGTDPSFDLDGDGQLGEGDLEVWLAEAGSQNLGVATYLRGDFNLDQVVDGSDFLAWNSNKFSSTTGYCAGNNNVDDVVDVRDLAGWEVNKFTSARGPSGDGIPDLVYNVFTGLLTIDTDGARVRGLVVEGPPATMVDWQPGLPTPGTGATSLTWIQQYFAARDQWYAVNPLLEAVLDGTYTIGDYGYGLGPADFGEVLVVLDGLPAVVTSVEVEGDAACMRVVCEGGRGLEGGGEVCLAQPAPAGEPCVGSDSNGVCDPADTCNAVGECVENLAPAGASCGDGSDTDCDDPDTCDGNGACLTNTEAPGWPCGDPSDTDCDAPDTCDGSGTCETNLVPPGTSCGDPNDDACDDPDSCDAAGECLANLLPDADGDGFCDEAIPSDGPCDTGASAGDPCDDNCVADANDQTDTDDDGGGDPCDADDDNDGVEDLDDLDPTDPLLCQDLDLDTCDDCTGNPADDLPWTAFIPAPAGDGDDEDGDGICDEGDGTWFSVATGDYLPVTGTIHDWVPYELAPLADVVTPMTPTSFLPSIVNLVALDVQSETGLLFAVDRTRPVADGAGGLITLQPSMIYRRSDGVITLDPDWAALALTLPGINAVDQLADGSFVVAVRQAIGVVHAGTYRYMRPWILYRVAPDRFDVWLDAYPSGFRAIDGVDVLPGGTAVSDATNRFIPNPAGGITTLWNGEAYLLGGEPLQATQLFSLGVVDSDGLTLLLEEGPVLPDAGDSAGNMIENEADRRERDEPGTLDRR